MTLYFAATGQSNCVGRGAGGSTSISSLVKVWNNKNERDDLNYLGSGWVTPDLDSDPFVNGRNNMMLHFANQVALDTGEQVRLVIVAKGALDIAEWYSASQTQAMYNRLRAVLNQANVSALDAFLWHQGESDGSTNAQTYIGRFGSIMSSLRSEGFIGYGTPVLVGETASGQTINATLNYMAKLSPYLDCANLDGLATTDGTHFTGSSLVAAGAEYFSRYENVKSRARSICTA